MNEQWNALPFGHEGLYLDTLTVIPRRAATGGTQYAEVADLSQSHALAYILSETLKSLRNVRTVVVRNDGCFSDVVWRLMYRSLVYRLWKWGGRLCGLGLREFEDEKAFEVLCGGEFEESRKVSNATGKSTGDGRGRDECWRDVREEVNRLIGAEGSRDGMDAQVLDAL